MNQTFPQDNESVPDLVAAVKAVEAIFGVTVAGKHDAVIAAYLVAQANLRAAEIISVALHGVTEVLRDGLNRP